LIGAGFLYGSLAAAYLGTVLWLGASLPTSAPGWVSLAFLALGPCTVAAVSQSYSMPRLGPTRLSIGQKGAPTRSKRRARQRATTRVTTLAYWKFESIPLQRRVTQTRFLSRQISKAIITPKGRLP